MFKRIKNTLKDQLTQGATPEKLAQSLSVGILLGCFPLIGFTTGLAAIAGVVFKLNHIVTQTANYLMYPVQIILIPVYIKVISMITDVGNVPVRPDLIVNSFTNDWVGFVKTYALVGVYAVILWLAISLILVVILQKLFLPLILRLKNLKDK